MSNRERARLDEVFCRQRQPLLRTVMRVIRDPAVAEDLVQETYLRVRAALSERPVTYLQPFLYQTATNLARDHVRAERRWDAVVERRSTAETAARVASPAPSQETLAGDQELLRHLEAALDRLTPRQRRVFHAARVEGRTQDAIAADLGVSKSTVQKDLRVAMAACVEVFQRLQSD